MISLSSQTNELYQLASVAFCLIVASCSDKLGLKLVVEPIRNFFAALFLASIGMLIHGKLYLLLLGTTALSLVTTPFLFKLIPAVVHLGVLLRWFSPELLTEYNLTSRGGKIGGLGNGSNG
nr:hypothetical protein [Tanacetum cinerariifolium]